MSISGGVFLQPPHEASYHIYVSAKRKYTEERIVHMHVLNSDFFSHIFDDEKFFSIIVYHILHTEVFSAVNHQI